MANFFTGLLRYLFSLFLGTSLLFSAPSSGLSHMLVFEIIRAQLDDIYARGCCGSKLISCGDSAVGSA